MFKKILLAVDGSAASQKAVEWARKTYEELPHSQISILYVHLPAIPVGPAGGVYIPITYEQANPITPEETPAYDAWNQFPDKQRVTYDVEEGNPAELICRRAREEQCDVIVLGAEGHGLVSSVLLGSVSAKVLHQASVSVLIIR
ncbi:universal stress protein [Brevibacillus sp. SYSU BS000544]|uniref:universal stress protein n=1 Tax=Brevibacillus sp. SYSU BS000544 TaxID=3416443 RepID=UPI003CE4BA40